MKVNPLNKDDLKIQWESYRIVEKRISQLENKYPDDFKIWMADRYSSVFSMRNNFWNIGPTIFNRFQDKYPHIEQETLIQQKEWFDHSSSVSNVMSPEMAELSINQAIPPTPPAAPAPPTPPAPTEQGAPNQLLDQIKKGLSLKHTETKIKDNGLKGKEVPKSTQVNAEPSSSKQTLDGMIKDPNISSSKQIIENPTDTQNLTLTEKFSVQFNKIRKAVQASDDEDDPTQNVWADDDKQIDSSKPIVENKTPIEMQSSLNNMINRIKASVTSTPRVESVGLQPELTPLTELFDKGKNLQTLEDLKQDDKETLEKEILLIKPDDLFEKVQHLPHTNIENTYINELIIKNVDENINKMLEENPGLGKQQLIEKLIRENPLHKEKILSIVTQSVNKQWDKLESKLSEKDMLKFRKILVKEDLKELEDLGEYKTIDQIKTVSSVNKSHTSLLNEIKAKASRSSLVQNQDLIENQVESSYVPQTSNIDKLIIDSKDKNKEEFNTNKLDDTMNLFE